MVRCMVIFAAIICFLFLLGYICTGNILGHEFNRLFPEKIVSQGSQGKILSGKNIVCLGDSIFGMTRNCTAVTSYLAKETGATVYNAGFGGTRMSVHSHEGYGAFSMYVLADAIAQHTWELQELHASQGVSSFQSQLQILRQIDFSTVDIIIIHFGTNDFTANPGIEPDNPVDPLDFETVAGALRYSIQKLQTAFPHIQIYVSLPLYRYWKDTKESSDVYRNSLGKLQEEYVDAVRQAAYDCRVQVIDGFEEMGMNESNIFWFTLDGVHLSRAGRKKMAELIGSSLLRDIAG